jgi:predicted Zn-dependent peptidase
MNMPPVLAACALSALVLVVAPAATAAPSVSRHVLEDGLTVLVRENPAAPVVAVSLQVRAGSRFETAEQAGITNFLLRTMIRGTRKRSAVQLAEAAEGLGGSLEASGEVEAAELRAQALSRNWEALLDLVAEVVREPAFPPEEIERERRLLLSQLQTRADTPFPLSFDTLLRDLYAGHPYGWPSLGIRASVERLQREALLAHYREAFRPERVVLAVSGLVPRERVVKVAERLFGRLPRSGAPTVEPPPVPAAAGGRRVLERPAQQAQVLVGYLGPGLRDPDYPAVRVLATVLGGGMSGRLFVEIRDKRGLAYSLGVLTPYRTGAAFFVAYLGTARPNAAAAEAAVLQEIERIRTAPVTPEELARAKAYLLGRLALDRRTNARQAWYLAFFEATGAGWDFPERYAKAVEAVTAANLAAVAGRYLVRPTIVVLTPPER